MPRVAVIIVNWNGKHHLETCLPALFEQSFCNFVVVLVDNGSQDGSVEWVDINFPDVILLPFDENKGFAYPNNYAITWVLENTAAKYLITLNNDTKVDHRYIEELLAMFGRMPDAGSVQPRVMNYFNQEIFDSVGILISKDLAAVNRGLKEKNKGQFDIEEEIFGASASAAMYSKEALEAITLTNQEGHKEYFDNDYFAYYEDVDLAWRLRLAGYKSYYTPQAKVFHVHSATGKNYSPFKAFYIHRNQYFNIIKNLPIPQMGRAMVLMPKLYLASFMSVLKGRGAASELAVSSKGAKNNPFAIVLRGWFDVLRMLPRMLAKRRQVQAMRVVDRKEIERWFRDYKADFSKIISG